MRFRALLVAAGVVAACRALPSAVPLADSGKDSAPSGANDRDRRSISTRDDGEGGGAADEAVVTAEPKSPTVVAAAADAGMPESGSAPAGDSGATPQWPGEYYGSDRFVRRIDSEPDDVQTDDKAHTRVEQPSPSALLISVVNSASGDVICALRAGLSRDGASEATLESGQSCFAGEGVEARVTSGRATITGDLLTLDFEGTVESEDDDEGSGRDSYHFEGRRR